MVDETTIPAHPVTVDDQTAVQVQAVVMGVVDVNGGHPFFELLVGHHLAYVFQDEFAAFDGKFGPDAPTLKRFT